MSQFDLPRLNFFGEAIINPPTANNNAIFPLVLFDPVQVKAVIPPRIYLSEKLMHIHSLGLFALPENTPLLTNEAHGSYFEINTVNNPQIFKQWAITRLGESAFDAPFHPLYNLIRTARGNHVLTGLIPSNWNYFGGMDFGFDHVSVTSIEVQGMENKSICYTNGQPNCPPDIEQIMGASVELKDEKGKNTAVMVDAIPSLPYYTQIFCDSFIIRKSGKKVLNGKPGKASLRFLNANRIVNQEGAIAGSGTFYCVIPISDLEEGLHAPIMQLFERYQTQGGSITGVSIRYNLFEVKENQDPDYQTLRSFANPARCSVLGSITPWYENELKSITMGRQMIPVHSYLAGKTLPPIVFSVNKERKFISLDLIGSIPELCTQDIYETYDLGELKIKCVMGNHEEIDISSIFVSQQQLCRDKIIAKGGMIDIPYSENTSLRDSHLECGLFLIYGMSKKEIHEKGTEALLMKESEFMVASDQAGVYMNQHDDPRRGYICEGPKREPCKVTIYHKGKPFDGVIPMTIQELRVKSLGVPPVVSTLMETMEFMNNQELQFPSDDVNSGPS